MESVKQWGFSLCAAMVACGIARMMLPKSSLEKMFRMVISVFFICAILSPVALRYPDLMIAAPTQNEAEISARSDRVKETADIQTLARMRTDIEKMITDKLSQRGIKVHAVTINITTDGQNSVRITSAEVVLKPGYPGELKELGGELESELGCRVAVRD